MSINDLLDSEILIPAMFVMFVVVMIFAIPAGLAMARKPTIIFTVTMNMEQQRKRKMQR